MQKSGRHVGKVVSTNVCKKLARFYAATYKQTSSKLRRKITKSTKELQESMKKRRKELAKLNKKAAMI